MDCNAKKNICVCDQLSFDLLFLHPRMIECGGCCFAPEVVTAVRLRKTKTAAANGGFWSGSSSESVAVAIEFLIVSDRHQDFGTQREGCHDVCVAMSLPSMEEAEEHIKKIQAQFALVRFGSIFLPAKFRVLGAHLCFFRDLADSCGAPQTSIGYRLLLDGGWIRSGKYDTQESAAVDFADVIAQLRKQSGKATEAAAAT